MPCNSTIWIATSGQEKDEKKMDSPILITLISTLQSMPTLEKGTKHDQTHLLNWQRKNINRKFKTHNKFMFQTNQWCATRTNLLSKASFKSYLIQVVWNKLNVPFKKKTWEYRVSAWLTLEKMPNTKCASLYHLNVKDNVWS